MMLPMQTGAANGVCLPRRSLQNSIRIVSGQKIEFALNAPYMAKGELIEGEQTVEFSEGGILWRGMQYRELTFTPQSPTASFSLHDVTKEEPI